MSTNRSPLPRPARWLALLLAAALSMSAAAEERDPEAVELARGVLAAMGGEEAWAATRFSSSRPGSTRSTAWPT